jgi:hypothetical protein
MKTKVKTTTKQKQTQKQKQSVVIKNVINIKTGKLRKRQKPVVGVQKGRAPLPTMMTNVYHQYYSPIPQPVRSIVAQTINPIADNVLPSVAKAEQIVKGNVLDSLYKVKQEEKKELGINIPNSEEESKGMGVRGDIEDFLSRHSMPPQFIGTPLMYGTSSLGSLPSPTSSIASGLSKAIGPPSSSSSVLPVVERKARSRKR